MLSSLAKHVDKAKFLLNENSTTVLTVLGVGGTIATAVLTGRATFKAAEIIAKESTIFTTEERDGSTIAVEVIKEPSKSEKAKLVWRQYLPPVASGVMTIACIIVANRISSKKIAALTVAAGVSERALAEYKEKVVEKLTARQEEKIRDEIAQDRVDNRPPTTSEIIITGKGDVLCMDMLTGRYFQSSVESIKRAENVINRSLINHMDASLSEFFDEIGLSPTSYSDTVGWNAAHPVEVKISATLSSDQRPCLAIDFQPHPFTTYSRFHE
jgi:Family of unknown function (DUF6353)